MATKRVTVCDRDGSDVEVGKYRLGVAGGSLYTMELCGKCAAPVKDLIAAHEAAGTTAARFKVVPLDQVKPAKRPARKGTVSRARKRTV